MFLVYEKNYMVNGIVDCVEESDMKLCLLKEDAIDDMRNRKNSYCSYKNEDFTFMEDESDENCFVIADGLEADGESRCGEFHICLAELVVH